MTESAKIAKISIPLAPERSRTWQRYLTIGLLANVAIWGCSLLYLVTKSPTYTSKWTVTIPSEGMQTNVDLPEIGGAFTRSDSPYNNAASYDPRENYKYIAQSNAVLTTAAEQLNLAPEQFETPRVSIIDNTTLMELEIRGATPQGAQKKAIALQQAFETELTQLRQEKLAQQDGSLQSVLSKAQANLNKAQENLSGYRANAGLTSREQLTDLSRNIEELRRQRAESLAQLQNVNASFQELSSTLGLSSKQAANAFVLQADPLFQAYLNNYSAASAELAGLESKFTEANPLLAAKQAERESAYAALLQRGELLLGQSVNPTTLAQLNLNTNSSSNSQRANLLQQLISVQTERKGIAQKAQELDNQIGQLETRLRDLAQQESNLEGLKRDVQIAEAVFSSTLTQLDLSKAEIFSSYPQVQILAKPSLPQETSAPNETLVLLGTALSSLFITTGIVTLWWRDRQSELPAANRDYHPM